MEHEMEPLVVVVLLGCSGLVVVVIAGRLKQLHAPGKVYAAFAERLKGTVLEKRALGCLPFSFPWGVRFSHHEVGVQLHYDLQGGTSCYHLIELTFGLPELASFLCRVEIRKPRLSKLSWSPLRCPSVGLREVRIGAQAFDDQFSMKANDERKARQVLNPEVQETLLQLSQWAREHVHMYGGSLGLVMAGKSVQFWVTKPGATAPTSDDLVTLYQFCGSVYDAAARAL